MRKIILLFSLMFSVSVYANCPLADYLFKKKNEIGAVEALRNCALNLNDDESQIKLARAYAKGDYGLKRDANQSLYFYQLSAENGNALAQVNLAESLIIADEKPKSRKKVLEYYIKLMLLSKDKVGENRYAGEIIHPYAWLKLASESPDKKWYYPSLERAAPAKTLSLLRNYQIPEEMKKFAMRQATQFKTRKILQLAKEILPSDEYPIMEQKLKSKQTRVQAMEELKVKMEEYIQRKKDARKTNDKKVIY